LKLQGRVAIVTGAGRNIGEAVSEVLAAEGASVAVVDIDPKGAQRVVDQIKAKGGKAAAFKCDAAVDADIKKTVADVAKTFGKIDILVNNVAIADNKTLFEITTEDWNRCIAVTLTAPFLFTKYTAEDMVARKQKGAIILIGSTSGYFGRARALAYTTAKSGIANLTRSLAYQLGPHNIRVNSIVPNKVGSPVGSDVFDPTRPIRNLVNRTGMPMDIANAVLFLVSDDSSFIAGTDLFVDGGCAVMMPGNEAEK
jgi:NAD(P)-dependent dehydrogenase (short-subunit alcohol dehydrogenase family)